ncbi:hypothetical protein HZS_2811, partial [Henneguya salminicola]
DSSLLETASEYEPESEHESIDCDQDYILTDESYSEDYLSDDSFDEKRKRKNSDRKSIFKYIKRPALKTKSRFKKTHSSSESSAELSEWDDDGRDDSAEISETEEALRKEKVEQEPFETIEKVVKVRKGAKGDIGGSTSLYMKLIGKYVEPTEIEESEDQYLIKWKDWSYLHCTWENIDSLKNPNIKGFKKLENYIKKYEDYDLNDSELIESIKEPIHEYTSIDRVLASRLDAQCPEKMEYLCKWKCLAYEECTWEEPDLVETLFMDSLNKFRVRQTYYIPPFDIRYLSNISYNKDKLSKKLEILNNGNCKGLKLRDYQVEGVKWLIHSCLIRNSVILADEMGLGKTVQIIKYIDYFNSEFNIGGPHLIIVPLSTLDTWVKHFSIWAPILHVVAFIGNAKSREIIRAYELIDQDSSRLKFNVLITTYEWVFKESCLFSSYNWFSMIIDEGHKIKNENSMLYQALYDFKSYHRILMTGTPLQNSLRELWSLLHFIMPHKFSDPNIIEQYAEYADKQQGYEELKSHISEFILRRTKKDVEKSLPPKIEQILRVDMTNMQKKYYRWILTKNYEELSRERKGNIGGFLNIIMELKKCCNHADLVQPENQQFYTDDVNSLLIGSGKLILLDKLLCRLHQNKSRVLIFSQMVMMLDILSQYLTKRHFNFQRLDGSMNEAARNRSIEHFNSPGSTDFCFLLSTLIQTMDPRGLWGSSGSNSIVFGKDELSMILKFGAEELFKQNIPEEGGIIREPLQELDLDDIMKLAERNDNDVYPELSRGEEFLSSFKVANFKTLEVDNNFLTESSRWEDIIPKSEIAKIQNDNYLKKQAELYLPPRRERQQKSKTETCAENSGEDISDQENSITLRVNSLSRKNIKNFIKEYEKFPKASKRLDELLKSCNLTVNEDSSNMDAYEKISQFLESSLANVKKGVKNVRIKDLTIDLEQFSQSRKLTDIIGDAVEIFIRDNPLFKISEIKTKFLFPFKTQRVKWTSKWNTTDDSRLFVGIYYHGLYNWKSIFNDKSLNLSSKLKNKKGRIVPSKILTHHVSHLVRLIQKYNNPPVPIKSGKKNSNLTKSKPSLVKSKSTDVSKAKPTNDEGMEKCIQALRSVKANIYNLEGVTSKDLPKHLNDIKKIGSQIYSRKSKSFKLTAEIFWNFVARFTSVSPKEIISFYNKN